ncbi:MAG: cytochrome ubiquinol oxidase subunit I [Candidatus Rehaiarchaeum fermentans]|nr:cytochrome ubiquinol oxidase subunit I [Candidatus Rehaiarchaeum fermentans]
MDLASYLIFSRFIQGFSLGVHIIFASLGIGLPIIIVISEILGRKDKYFLLLAKKLIRPFIVLFAIGTASGIIVALELFVLWPNFMTLVGQVAILPFYVEVFAFFAESIFIGVYFYSLKNLGKISHIISGLIIAIGASLSGALITMINAFMNTPTGFNIQAYLTKGIITDVNPLSVFNTPSTFVEISHVLPSSFLVAVSIVLIYVIFSLFRSTSEESKIFYNKSLRLLLILGFIGILLTGISGMDSIKSLANTQPEKYAALEANYAPSSNASEIIFGIPEITQNGSLVVKDALVIPRLQSFLLGGTAPGLKEFNATTFPPSLYPSLYQNVPAYLYNDASWPPLFVHDTFDFMALSGFVIFIVFLIAFLFLLFEARNLRIRFINKFFSLNSKFLLYLIIFVSILSIITLELGWVTAEVGRQPWIIYDVMTVNQGAEYSSFTEVFSIMIVLFYSSIIPLTYFLIKKVSSKESIENEMKRL